MPALLELDGCLHEDLSKLHARLSNLDLFTPKNADEAVVEHDKVTRSDL